MLYFFMFLIGACLGSFINVIFSRKDWYTGRSRCDSCGYTLKWYDMIPIIGYTVLRGKCRKCGTKIDSSHFFAELFMGTVFIVMSVCIERYNNMYALLVCITLFLFSVYAIEDMKEKAIYSWLLNMGVLSTAILKGYIIYKTGTENLYIYIFTVVLIKIFFWAVSKAVKKIGAGDFDMFIMLYILFGDYGCMLCLMLSSFIGCAIYLPAIFLKKYDRKEPMALAPLLFIGTMYCVLV